VEASEELKQAIEEAFERGEREIRESADPPPTEPGF
jgi:hypothetical protein